MTFVLKYSEEFVLQELKSLLDILKANPDIIYIWELFEHKDYTRQRFSEWTTMYYPNNKEIVWLSDTIKGILESRAVKWAMTNKLNSTMTIFHLKNNYDWKDKSEVDNNNKGELILNWWNGNKPSL